MRHAPGRPAAGPTGTGCGLRRVERVGQDANAAADGARIDRLPCRRLQHDRAHRRRRGVQVRRQVVWHQRIDGAVVPKLRQVHVVPPRPDGAEDGARLDDRLADAHERLQVDVLEAAARGRAHRDEVGGGADDGAREDGHDMVARPGGDVDPVVERERSRVGAREDGARIAEVAAHGVGAVHRRERPGVGGEALARQVAAALLHLLPERQLRPRYGYRRGGGERQAEEGQRDDGRWYCDPLASHGHWTLAVRAVPRLSACFSASAECSTAGAGGRRSGSTCSSRSSSSGLPVVDAPERDVVGGLYTDPQIFVWSFAWWPHAIAHGIEPGLHARDLGARAASTSPGRRASRCSRSCSRR